MSDIDFNEMPMGFGMSLARDEQAFTNYAKLPVETKNQIISYIKSAATGNEVKQRIHQTINNLSEGSTPNMLG